MAVAGAERAARGALVVAAALLAARSFPRLVATWVHEASWLHPGAFVLAVALAVRALHGEPRGATRFAPLFLGGGLALFALGSLSGEWTFAWLALPALLLGVASVAGRGRELLPAAALLVLAVPPPNVAIYHLVALSKSWVAEAATLLLALSGVAARREGWSIVVTGGEIRILDSCSGVRTQAGLLVITAIVLCLRPTSPAARKAMLLATVPAAFASSVVRLMVVAIARSACGQGLVGERFFQVFHDVTGFLVIVPAVLAVLAAGRVAPWLWPATPPSEKRWPGVGPRGAAVGAVAAGLILAAGLLRAPAPCRCRPVELPGVTTPDRERIEPYLRPDWIDVRRFEGVQAALIHFHALEAPYDVFRHAFEVCHSLGGWATLDATDVVTSGGLTVRQHAFARGATKRLVHAVYLDDALGTPEASAPVAWLRTIGRGLAGRPTGGTLLLVSTGDLDRVDAPLRERELARVEAILARIGASRGNSP